MKLTKIQFFINKNEIWPGEGKTKAMLFKFSGFAFSLVLLFVLNCTTPMGFTRSRKPIQKPVYEKVGQVAASAGYFSFFGSPLNAPNLDKLLDSAQAQKKADNLVAIKYHSTLWEFGIFQYISYDVSAEAIRYSAE